MPTLELTISTRYVPNWTVLDGIRELIQNGLDAQVEGFPLSIERRDSGVVSIKNVGAKLERSHLLLGGTTKQGRQDQIGQFGEGLKLGTMALLRAGYKVAIRTGSETWTPRLSHSQTFGTEVLAFDIAKGRKHLEGVEVKVRSVTPELWEQVCRNTLLLQSKPPQAVSVDGGSILTGTEERGRVYARGLFVGTFPNYAYGYNLGKVNLDRDRRLLDTSDAAYKISLLWERARSGGQVTNEMIYELLERESDDSRSIQWAVPDHIIQEVFIARYGADALPCSQLDEAKKLEHLGRRGIIVNQVIGQVLGRCFGSFATIIQELGGRKTRLYQLGDIPRALFALLESLLELLDIPLAHVQIVDFQDPGHVGMWEDGKISIARKLLDDPVELIATLLHEAAHEDGGDGDASHRLSIERRAGQALARALGLQVPDPETSTEPAQNEPPPQQPALDLVPLSCVDYPF